MLMVIIIMPTTAIIIIIISDRSNFEHILKLSVRVLVPVLDREILVGQKKNKPKLTVKLKESTTIRQLVSSSNSYLPLNAIFMVEAGSNGSEKNQRNIFP